MKRIPIKSKEEISKMKDSCRIVAEILENLKEYIIPGIPTVEIENVAVNLIKKRGGYPAFKNFNGFPSNICVSINEEVVHGMPHFQKIVNEGDIVSVDVGVEKNGYYGDAAYTYPVGKISKKTEKLLKVTKKSLLEGINQAYPGNRLGDISNKIQKICEAENYGIVKDLVGHGIGTQLHEPPQIPNFGKKKTGPKLKAGMALAIEPMINLGGYQVKTLSDGWTVVTKDGLPSAHYEHTIHITDNGPVILTIL